MKGQVNYAFVGLVIVLAFLLVTVPLYGGVKNKSEDSLYHKVCMDSVAMSGRFDMKSGDSLKCPMVEDPRPESNKMDAMKVIKNRLVDTWDEFHAGRPNLFDTALYDTQSFCIFRYIEVFENGDKIGLIPADDFTAYLKSETIYRQGENQYVLDYLSGYKTSEIDDWDLDKFSTKMIDPTKPLAIAVVYSKTESLNDVWLKATAPGVGLAVLTIVTGGSVMPVIFFASLGAAGGIVAIESKFGLTQDHDAGILLVPYTVEAISKLKCTYLPADQSIMEGVS